MDGTTNSLNWFEIPTINIERSRIFYETIFDLKMGDTMDMEGMKYVFFPFEPESGKANGALAESPDHKPSMEGAIIYLNANPDLADVIARVEEAGGQILVPKTSIGGNGYFSFIKDTEGNKIGIHSGQ